MADGGEDAELKAIQQLINALEPLEPDARSRVIEYVFQRLGFEGRKIGHDLHSVVSPAQPGSSAPSSVQHPQAPHGDIRSLTDVKNPKTANEMAAVVAYYL